MTSVTLVNMYMVEVCANASQLHDTNVGLKKERRGKISNRENDCELPTKSGCSIRNKLSCLISR